MIERMEKRQMYIKQCVEKILRTLTGIKVQRTNAGKQIEMQLQKSLNIDLMSYTNEVYKLPK